MQVAILDSTQSRLSSQAHDGSQFSQNYGSSFPFSVIVTFVSGAAF